MERGTFEMATVDGYRDADCHLCGPFAVHRFKPSDRWRISHAETGMAIPYAYATTLVEAKKICDALAEACDWSLVKRTKKIGRPAGLDKIGAAVVAALQSLGLKQ